MMAVWTPGSYLVREYARNVEAVTAAGPDGRALDVDKSKKNHWRVTTGGAPSITLKYRVYCREMSVRTNWVESDFALINGAPTFITLADLAPRPHEVIINPARDGSDRSRRCRTWSAAGAIIVIARPTTTRSSTRPS